MASSFPLGERPTPRRLTAKAVIDAYNTWNMEDIMAFRAPDCVQIILPSNITILSKAPLKAYLTIS